MLHRKKKTQSIRPLLVLLQSIQRICNNTLEGFAHEFFNVFRCCLDIRFLQLQCWTGWDAWSSGPHCRSQTCSQMLHQVAIVFPSLVKTGRSPSSSTPTIVAFVPPGMTSWHDDTTRAQARDPIHGVKPWEATSSNTCARMCQGACEPHSALRLETRVPDKHP